MNIRPLKTADIFTIIGMLKKVGNTKLTSMFVADTGATKKEKPDENLSVRLGMLVLSELYDNVVDDLKAWFADLISKTPAEYMELPAVTTLDIIDQLVDGDAKDFFLRALQLYRKISKSKNGSKKE